MFNNLIKIYSIELLIMVVIYQFLTLFTLKLFNHIFNIIFYPLIFMILNTLLYITLMIRILLLYMDYEQAMKYLKKFIIFR